MKTYWMLRSKKMNKAQKNYNFNFLVCDMVTTAFLSSLHIQEEQFKSVFLITLKSYGRGTCLNAESCLNMGDDFKQFYL